MTNLNIKQNKIIIVGSGPAAWTAALYTARADLHPLVLAGEKSGGQLTLTTLVENFPGFPQGIDGPELMVKLREQAERFGTEVREEQVLSIKPNSQVGDSQIANGFVVTTSQAEYETRAVVVATGAEAVRLEVPGETEFLGRGVSTCAVCDAAFFRGKRTYVIGGGDAAMEDALALTRFAETVTVVHRRDSFKASKVMVDRVLKHAKITVIWNSSVGQIVGDKKVTGLTLKNLQSNQETILAADGVFIAIGHRPTTDFLKNTITLDEKGYIKTGITGLDGQDGVEGSGGGWKSGYPTMTSVEGIFAAGDCVDFRYRQAGVASGWGIMAALDAETWLEMV